MKNTDQIQAKCNGCGHDIDSHDTSGGGCDIVTKAYKNGRPIEKCQCEFAPYMIKRGDVQ